MVNYRECRIVTLYEIFKLSEREIDLQKVFLILGGIKNYLYVMKKNSLNIFFPGGFTDISCDNVFNTFGIEHEIVELSDFIDNYSFYEKVKTNKIYIMPFSAEILKVTDIKNIDLTTFGQSYLPIKYVDLKERKIFLEDGKAKDNDWIDLDICYNIKNYTLSFLNGLNIYAIDKTEIKNNSQINKCFEQSYISLLKKVLNGYHDNETFEYEQDFIRIGGRDTFDVIINQFDNLKMVYNNYELKLKSEALGKDQDMIEEKLKTFRKYLFMEIRYFRQFILSGTDAYYRNEFLDVLEHINFPENIRIDSNIQKWRLICNEWRKFGRELNILFFRRKDETSYFYNCIESLTSTFKRIKELELATIDELKNLIINC